MDWFAVEQAVGSAATTVTSFWMVLKWVYVFALGMFVVFAVVVVSQVKQMLRALYGGFDRGMKLIAWGYLGLTVLSLLLAIVVL